MQVTVAPVSESEPHPAASHTTPTPSGALPACTECRMRVRALMPVAAPSLHRSCTRPVHAGPVHAHVVDAGQLGGPFDSQLGSCNLPPSLSWVPRDPMRSFGACMACSLGLAPCDWLDWLAPLHSCAETPPRSQPPAPLRSSPACVAGACVQIPGPYVIANVSSG